MINGCPIIRMKTIYFKILIQILRKFCRTIWSQRIFSILMDVNLLPIFRQFIANNCQFFKAKSSMDCQKLAIYWQFFSINCQFFGNRLGCCATWVIEKWSIESMELLLISVASDKKTELLLRWFGVNAELILFTAGPKVDVT